jgi:hypothetical protein
MRTVVSPDMSDDVSFPHRAATILESLRLISCSVQLGRHVSPLSGGGPIRSGASGITEAGNIVGARTATISSTGSRTGATTTAVADT